MTAGEIFETEANFLKDELLKSDSEAIETLKTRYDTVRSEFRRTIRALARRYGREHSDSPANDIKDIFRDTTNDVLRQLLQELDRIRNKKNILQQCDAALSYLLGNHVTWADPGFCQQFADDAILDLPRMLCKYAARGFASPRRGFSVGPLLAIFDDRVDGSSDEVAGLIESMVHDVLKTPDSLADAVSSSKKKNFNPKKGSLTSWIGRGIGLKVSNEYNKKLRNGAVSREVPFRENAGQHSEQYRCLAIEETTGELVDEKLTGKSDIMSIIEQRVEHATPSEKQTIFLINLKENIFDLPEDFLNALEVFCEPGYRDRIKVVQHAVSCSFEQRREKLNPEVTVRHISQNIEIIAKLERNLRRLSIEFSTCGSGQSRQAELQIAEELAERRRIKDDQIQEYLDKEVSLLNARTLKVKQICDIVGRKVNFRQDFLRHTKNG